VQVAQGDSGAALKSYQADLAIAEWLATGDPHNTQWQRDLSASYWKLAGLGGIAYSVDARRAMLEKGLNILNNLRARGQSSASDASWIKEFEKALQAP
jgi:hypothetical protein